MDRTAYFNDLMARIEELFYHEMSDCACWKTEFIGVDFIQALDIQGNTPQEIIENWSCDRCLGNSHRNQSREGICGL